MWGFFMLFTHVMCALRFGDQNFFLNALLTRPHTRMPRAIPHPPGGGGRRQAATRDSKTA